MLGDLAKYRHAAARCLLIAKSSSNWVECLALASSWYQIAEQDESLPGSIFECNIAALGADSLAAFTTERPGRVLKERSVFLRPWVKEA
jgi:hypothetical protein